MAGQLSHIVAGEAALAEAFGKPPSATGAAGAFRFGCQGPDIFYHNQRTKPSGLHYGALAHRRRYGSLVAAALAALPDSERRPESPAGAYVLGLATHAALDRSTHPYIVNRAGWAKPADPATEPLRGCHPFLERVLDFALLRSRGAAAGALEALDLAEDMGLPRSGRPTLPEDELLVRLWAAGLRAAYPRSTGSDGLLELRIANALVDARSFYRDTDPAHASSRAAEWFLRHPREEGRRLVALVFPLLDHSSLDPMNLARAEWLHPAGDGRRSRASYPELVDEGAREGARAIRWILGQWSGKQEGDSEELSSILGEGGLSICDGAGESIAPLVCAPLALPAAMDAEYAARIAAQGDRDDRRPDKR
jgi:hypothetical protein